MEENPVIADVLISYSPGPDPGFVLSQPYGNTICPQSVAPDDLVNVSPSIVTQPGEGNLSLPTGASVTVGFSSVEIFDAPGQPDLFIRECGGAGEAAEISVTSNGEDFFILGIADDAGTTSLFDLADYPDFEGPVRQVRVEGLDARGGSPGFDLIYVEGLPGSVMEVENTPPFAADDAATTETGVPVTVAVLENDTDPDEADELSIGLVLAPRNGTALIVDDGIRYTPQPGFVGTDSFDYTVNDGRDGEDVATVTVTVTEPDTRSDLVFEAVERADGATGALRPGDTIDLVARIRNSGETFEGAFGVDLKLVEIGGSQQTWDLRVANFQGTLGKGQVANVPVTRTVDEALLSRIGEGLFAVWGLADPAGVVDEASETNNVFTGFTLEIEGDGRPDFATSPVDDPDFVELVVGNRIDASFVVFNRGAEPEAGPLSLSAVLSRDLVISADDGPLQDFTISTAGLDDSGNSFFFGREIAAGLLADLDSGFYFILAGADPADLFAETSETNNVTVLGIASLSPEEAIEAFTRDRFDGDLSDNVFRLDQQGAEVVAGPGDDTGVVVKRRIELLEDVAPDGTVVLTDVETGGSDRLDSVETVQLLDGAYLYNLDRDEVPFTYRLYSAAFARRPDGDGLRFWVHERTDGIGDRALAQAFLDSREFADKFGADPTDGEFVDALYRNVLLRDPDAAGETFWLDAFSSGALDRVDMLLAFSESPENVARNADNYDDGVWVL